jgi:hypothetical protein
LISSRGNGHGAPSAGAKATSHGSLSGAWLRIGPRAPCRGYGGRFSTIVHQRDRSVRPGLVRVEPGHDVGLQSATTMCPHLPERDAVTGPSARAPPAAGQLDASATNTRQIKSTVEEFEEDGPKLEIAPCFTVTKHIDLNEVSFERTYDEPLAPRAIVLGIAYTFLAFVLLERIYADERAGAGGSTPGRRP